MKIRLAALTGVAGVLILVTGCASTTAGQAEPAVGAAAAVAASTSGSSSASSSPEADPGDGASDAAPASTSDSGTTDSSTAGDDTEGDIPAPASSSTSDGGDDTTTGNDDSTTGNDDTALPTVPGGSGMNAACLSVAGAALDVTQGKAGLTKLKADVAKAGTLPANLAKDFTLLEQTLSSASDSDDIYSILAGNTQALNAYTDISNWLTKNC